MRRNVLRIINVNWRTAYTKQRQHKNMFSCFDFAHLICTQKISVTTVFFFFYGIYVLLKINNFSRRCTRTFCVLFKTGKYSFESFGWYNFNFNFDWTLFEHIKKKKALAIIGFWWGRFIFYNMTIIMTLIFFAQDFNMGLPWQNAQCFSI